MANQISVNTGTGNQQVTVTSTGNIQVTTSRSVIGTVANVASANFANFAGNVTVANQPNITGVGTLGNLNVANTITTLNLSVTGNLSVGNLIANSANYANFANVANTANSVAGSNVVGAVGLATYATTANAVAGANVSGTVANATYAANAGNATIANSANSVAGANVSGTVANANYSAYANIAASANSVAVANVSGIGNIATINLDGNASNILYGNGIFATITIPAGDQISNGTSNVSIPVANSNVEIYANNQHWTFGTAGNLILAGGNGVVQSIANSSLDPIVPNVSTMVLTPDQGYTSQALVLDPTSPGHIHLRAPGSNIDQPQANVYLGGEASSFEVGIFNGAVPNLFIHSNNKTWMFDIDGNLTLPANTFAINYANGTQVPLDGPVANANYANFAGTVVNATQSNITSLGTLTGLNVTGNANINGTLIMSATTSNQVDISGVDNGSNATQRGITINAGTTFSPNVVSGTGGGATTIRGGNAWGNTDTGVVWNATSGAMQFNAGTAFTANGNATGGQTTLVAGGATTNKTGRAVGGLLALSSGGATANANTANSGNVQISTSFAVSNGVAKSGTISMQVGNANGVTGNIYGNIDIGTLNTPDFYSAPTSINIGQANTPTVIGGNVSAINANLGNLVTANFFSGDGSLLSNINGSNVSNVANANYANFAGTAYSVDGANVSGEVANANYATFAGTAYSVSGANVSGEVANANYATFAGTAYSIDGANVSGEVANANYATFAGTAYSVAGANVSGEVANANYASYAGNVTVNAQANITSLGNLVSLTINNGNVELPTKQFDPNGIDVGSNANILLMANSNFVDVDYGNGQGGGNLRFGKSTSYVKARGNSSAITTAAVNDVAGRTNYMFYNGTSNVLAAATQTNVTTFNANANAITTAGQYQIITGNPNGDQGNANALSNQNLYTFDSGGRLFITAGAATGTGSYLAMAGYGTTVGGNGAQSQAVVFTRYRGNRDANLSVQAGDQLGSFSFLGYNGAALYTARSSSLQAIVDSSYSANATVIPSNFNLTAAGPTFQNNNIFYGNGNIRLGTNAAGTGWVSNDSTLFVRNFEANANVTIGGFANVTGNLNVTANAIITGDLSAANVTVNTSGFMKLASYTATALNAITGQIGWMAAVSDSAAGGNPNGMIAFWDTTNSRWSYIHDNSAV